MDDQRVNRLVFVLLCQLLVMSFSYTFTAGALFSLLPAKSYFGVYHGQHYCFVLIHYRIKLRLVGFLAFCLLSRILVYIMVNIIVLC